MANFHVGIGFLQKKPLGEVVCGDVFHSRSVSEEGRKIMVLSDGIGHGVKANVLATLTASMALNYTSFHTKPEVAANIFMRALPKSSDGKESYATFTIVEIDSNELVRIINYDNPPTIILRNGKPYSTREVEMSIRGSENVGKILRIREFKPQLGDRIVFMSDGVTQSGLGGNRYPLGWGMDEVETFIRTQLEREPEMSSMRLVQRVINQASMNDGAALKDDSSCGAIYFRQPREMMLITGPPFYKIKDADFVQMVQNFPGKKIICGGTTAEIIARELNIEVNIEHRYADASIPPVAHMAGFEMVTEGILTMGKVEEILEIHTPESRLNDSPPEEVVKLLLEHDIIHIVVGTRINWAHHDPDQPVELEIRKFVVKRIVKLLEERFFKKVIVEYV